MTNLRRRTARHSTQKPLNSQGNKRLFCGFRELFVDRRERSAATIALLVASWLLVGGAGVRAFNLTFSPGDVFVSLEPGPVQWRLPDGTLNRILMGTVSGTGEGMAFDPSGNLYVSRWCIDPWCRYSGDTVEKFNSLGQSLGRAGSGYDCAPHAIVFDAGGTAYVGQAGCTGDILKFPPGMATPIAYAVAPDAQGSFWVDLAPDGCTMAYTSFGPNVKQFDVCAGVQLPDFNRAPLPGDAQDLRILPDGGVLVSSGDVIARLDASGVQTGTYEVAGETSWWAGLDLVGDGSFWAGNYETSNVYRFDLATGAVLGGFNAGTAAHTVVGVRVKK
jgi:outer membrane protein assembly factor BamB